MYPAPSPAEIQVSTATSLMTIGELARRTGMSRKSIRQLEGLGLIYSAGRTETNYRVFDDSALWCVRVINELRSLGLTLKEIQQLATVYLERPDEPIGPRLAQLLDKAHHRIEERLAELESVRRRIDAYRRENAAILSGTGAQIATRTDPCRRTRP